MVSVMAVAAILLAGNSAYAATEMPGHDKKEIAMTCPSVQSGLSLTINKRMLVVQPGEVYVNDKPITISGPVEFPISPCPILTFKNDPIDFILSEDKTVPAVAILNGTRASNNDSRVLPEVIVPDSLKLKGGTGPDAKVFKENVDFVTNAKQGFFIRLPNASFKPTDKVYGDYQVYLRRMDTLVVTEDGQLKIVEGVPSKSAPEPPHLDADCLPLANIYCAQGDKSIKKEDVMPIMSLAEVPPTTEQRLKNEAALSRSLRMLKSGEPMNIVFWGDSITAGADASDSQYSFANVVTERLKRKFPKCQIHVTNAGIGGSDTHGRAEKFDQQVLAYKPDLVIIQFINNIRLTPEVNESSYKIAMHKLKAAGCEVLIVIPSYCIPSIINVSDWKYLDTNAYFLFLRKLCHDENVAKADVALRCQEMSKIGLRPLWILVDETIHPSNYGHSIYADEIMKCFE